MGNPYNYFPKTTKEGTPHPNSLGDPIVNDLLLLYLPVINYFSFLVQLFINILTCN